MAEISAGAVKSLRERTGLPMMECKKALSESEGDEDKAIEILRKKGMDTAAKKAGRETSEGRIACCSTSAAGAMVELRCESAPVANNEEFRELAASLAEALAAREAADGESLLEAADPGRPEHSLGERFASVQNRLRENMKVARVVRWEGTTGSYVHHDGRKAAMILVDRAPDDAALLAQLCMHIVSMRPQALTPDDLDPALVAKEREILSEQARSTGKPENIIEKIVDGRMRNFFAEKVLPEQAYALDTGKTVRAVLKETGIEVVRFARWEVGEALEGQ
jgi:elongation factor Ts